MANGAAEIEVSQILTNARQEAENIVNAAKERVKVQLEDSSRLMMEIQQKMHQVIGTAGLDTKKAEHPVEVSQQPVSTPSPALSDRKRKLIREPKPELTPVYTPAREHENRKG